MTPASFFIHSEYEAMPYFYSIYAKCKISKKYP